MNSWQYLVHTALLGTEKRTLEQAQLRPSVAALLKKFSESDPESRFLNLATLAYVYERAGKLPLHSTADPVIADEDVSDDCASSLEEIFQTLLDSKPPNPEIWAYLLQKLAKDQTVIPIQFLTPVFQLATQNAFKSLQPLIPMVSGSRGKWLGQQHKAWTFASPKDPLASWETETNENRRKILMNLRAKDSKQALVLLKQAFDSERNARERKALIGTLQIPLAPEEVRFLEIVFDQLDPNAAAEKSASTSLRNFIMERLLSSPESAVFNHTVANLGKYFQLKRIIGLKGKWSLHVPDAPDDFLQDGHMQKFMGFDPTLSNEGMLKTKFWFSELVRNLHPMAWEQLLPELNWREIFQIFEESTWYLPKLAYALARTRYRKAVLAYTQEYVVDASNYFMLHALSNLELEKYVMHKSQGILSEYLIELLKRPDWVWSRPFSRFVLQCLLAPRSNGYHYSEIPRMLSLHPHFDPEVLPELESAFLSPSRDFQVQLLQQQVLAPMHRLILLRTKINAL